MTIYVSDVTYTSTRIFTSEMRLERNKHLLNTCSVVNGFSILINEQEGKLKMIISSYLYFKEVIVLLIIIILKDSSVKMESIYNFA